MNEDIKNDWCLIPPYIWKDPNLSLLEKCLLGRIQALQNSKGYCYAGNDYLSEQLGKTKNWISKVLKKLEDRQYISREIIYDNKGKISERRVYLLAIGIGEKTKGVLAKNPIPIGEKSKYRVDIREEELEETFFITHTKEETKPERTIKYLVAIPEPHVAFFTSEFNCNPKQVENKGKELYSYCKSKGKVYKDYKHFLANALRKDFGVRKSYDELVQEENPGVVIV